MSKVAVVRVSWTPSPSVDVVDQRVVVLNETLGEVIVETVVSPAVDSLVFEVPEKTDVSVSVVVSDGAYDSDPAYGSFSVGDLTAPLAVSGVGFEILEVKDLDVPAPVDPVTDQSVDAPTDGF